MLESSEIAKYDVSTLLIRFEIEPILLLELGVAARRHKSHGSMPSFPSNSAGLYGTNVLNSPTKKSPRSYFPWVCEDYLCLRGTVFVVVKA